MEIIREGKIYEVINEQDDEYCVAAPFLFADGATRVLKLWWNKKYCKIYSVQTDLKLNLF